MTTHRRRRQPDPPPAVIYREDHVAYQLCRVVNGGHCPCQASQIRACVTMEGQAVQVINVAERFVNVPRRPKGSPGEGLL